MPVTATPPFKFSRFVPAGAPPAPAPAGGRSAEERLAEALAQVDALRAELAAARKVARLVDPGELPSITPAQARVLQMILDFRADRGVSPSLREICDALGFASTMAAKGHLDALQRKEWVWSPPKRAARAVLPCVARIPAEKIVRSLSAPGRFS